jgi:hypothetical protein
LWKPPLARLIVVGESTRREEPKMMFMPKGIDPIEKRVKSQREKVRGRERKQGAQFAKHVFSEENRAFPGNRAPNCGVGAHIHDD